MQSVMPGPHSLSHVQAQRVQQRVDLTNAKSKHSWAHPGVQALNAAGLLDMTQMPGDVSLPVPLQPNFKLLSIAIQKCW